jgi:hypothetical protein
MLSIQAVEPFLILKTTLHDDETTTEPIEPENIGPTYKPNGQNASPRPKMCGCRDDVRTWMRKAQRAAALIYAHFKKEFGEPTRGASRNWEPAHLIHSS